MSSRKRTGADNRRMRAIAARKLANGPVPCRRCGIEISAQDNPKTWHAGHAVDEALGGEITEGNIWPEHAHCNTSAGGKLAHALKRQAADVDDRFRPGFWFPPRSSR